MKLKLSIYSLALGLLLAPVASTNVSASDLTVVEEDVTVMETPSAQIWDDESDYSDSSESSSSESSSSDYDSSESSSSDYSDEESDYDSSESSSSDYSNEEGEIEEEVVEVEQKDFSLSSSVTNRTTGNVLRESTDAHKRSIGFPLEYTVLSFEGRGKGIKTVESDEDRTARIRANRYQY